MTMKLLIWSEEANGLQTSAYFAKKQSWRINSQYYRAGVVLREKRKPTDLEVEGSNPQRMLVLGFFLFLSILTFYHNRVESP